MNKPVSLSVKDFVIRRMTVDTAVPEKIITAIIDNQFNSMIEATEKYNSLEISGLGRFIFSEKKALKKVEKYNALISHFSSLLEDETLTPKKRSATEARLTMLRKCLEHLNRRYEQIKLA